MERKPDKFANPIINYEHIVNPIKEAIESIESLMESQYDARGTDDYNEVEVGLLQTVKDKLEETIKPEIEL